MGVLDAENANRPSRPASSRPTGQTASGYQGLSGLVSSGGGGSRPSYSGSYGNSSGGTLTQAYNSGFNRGAAAAVGAGGSAMRVSRGSAAISQALGRSVPASNPFSAVLAQNTAPQIQNRANPVARQPPGAPRGTIDYLNQRAAVNAGVNMAKTPMRRTTANYQPNYNPTAQFGSNPVVARPGQTDFSDFYAPQTPRTFRGNQGAGAGGTPAPLSPSSGAPPALGNIFTPNVQQGFDPSANHKRVIDTLIAESNLQDPMGLISTAHVMNNRSKYSGASIYDVVSATNAFTGFNNPGDAAKEAMKNPVIREQAERAFQDAVTGRVPDPTGGSDYFRTPTASYGEELQRQLTPSVQMAGHEFFVGPKGDLYRTQGPWDRNAPKATEAEALFAGNQRPAEGPAPVMTSLAAEQMAADRSAKMPYASPDTRPQFVGGGIGSDRGDIPAQEMPYSPGEKSSTPYSYVSPITSRPEFPGELPARRPEYYTPWTSAAAQRAGEVQAAHEAKTARVRAEMLRDHRGKDEPVQDRPKAGPNSAAAMDLRGIDPATLDAIQARVDEARGTQSYTPRSATMPIGGRDAYRPEDSPYYGDVTPADPQREIITTYVPGARSRTGGIGADDVASFRSRQEHDLVSNMAEARNLLPGNFLDQFYDPAARRSINIQDIRDNSSQSKDKATSLGQQRTLTKSIANRRGEDSYTPTFSVPRGPSGRATAGPPPQAAPYSTSYTAEENADRADRRLESATTSPRQSSVAGWLEANLTDRKSPSIRDLRDPYSSDKANSLANQRRLAGKAQREADMEAKIDDFFLGPEASNARGRFDRYDTQEERQLQRERNTALAQAETPPANPIQAAVEGGSWMDTLKGGVKAAEDILKKGGDFIKDPVGQGMRAGIEYALANPKEALRAAQSAVTSGVSGAFDAAGQEVGKAMSAFAPRFVNAASQAGEAGRLVGGAATRDPVETALQVRNLSGSVAEGWSTLNKFNPTEMQKTRYSQMAAVPVQKPNLYDEPGYTPPEAPELVARALGPSGRLLEVAKGAVDTGKGPKAIPKAAVRDVTPRPAMPPQEAADIENTVKATTRPSEGMAERAAQVADARNQPRNRQVSTTSIPYAGEKGKVAMPAGDYSSPQTAPWQNDLPTAITQSASILQVDPVDLAGIIHFESGFNPAVKGGKNGVHVGLIQFGVPEQKQYGITTSSSVADQMQAATQFALDRGFKPGVHGAKELYATINAGNPGGGNKSDTAAGGTWGTANEKFFQQMNSSRAKGRELLGSKTYTGGYGGTGTTAFGQNLQDVTRAMPLGGGRSRPSVTSQVQTNVNSGVGPGAFQPNYVEAPPAAAGSPVVDGRPTRNGVPIAQPAGMAEPYSPAGPGARETGQSSPALVASLTERLQSYRGKDHAGTAISRQEVDDFLTRKHTRLLRRLTPEGRLELLAHVGRHEHGGRYPPGPTHAA